MPQIGNWIWDDDAKEWVKLRGTSLGAMSIHAIVEELDDIEDVSVADPADNEALIWDAATEAWVAEAPVPAAHKNSHDPQDGSDKLDSAAPVKIGEANAIGSSHSFPRADHVHEKHHAKYLDAEAVSAMGAKGDANPLHHNRFTNANATAAVKAHANLPVATITFIIDGGGSVITTGIKGDLEIPFACNINRWTLLADQSGSIVVNIWKQAYADFPPEVGEKITGDLPPTIDGAAMAQSATLTGWTPGITAGDCLRFNVDSIATCERVTLSLKVTKA